ncbi:hypothetical protein HNP02_006761 [Mycobacterium sp. AZCC_0083]|nr:hypothetical protein [Mycobacterium sp. AZCC_0083]
MHSTEQFADQHLAEAYAHCAPTGMRSSEDESLDLLPDTDIKAAMQALTQQFRDFVYYADVQGLRYQGDRGDHENPDRCCDDAASSRPTTTPHPARRRRLPC